MADPPACAGCGAPGPHEAMIEDRYYCHKKSGEATCYMRAWWEKTTRPPSQVPDLLDALERSVAEARIRRENRRDE